MKGGFFPSEKKWQEKEVTTQQLLFDKNSNFIELRREVCTRSRFRGCGLNYPYKQTWHCCITNSLNAESDTEGFLKADTLYTNKASV